MRTHTQLHNEHVAHNIGANWLAGTVQLTSVGRSILITPSPLVRISIVISC